jgi:hypothetical protein
MISSDQPLVKQLPCRERLDGGEARAQIAK